MLIRYAYDNLTGRGGNLTYATFGGLGKVYLTGGCSGNKYLFGKEGSRNVTGIGLNGKLRRITMLEGNIAGRSLESHFALGDNVYKAHTSGRSVGGEIMTGHVSEISFT